MWCQIMFRMFYKSLLVKLLIIGIDQIIWMKLQTNQDVFKHERENVDVGARYHGI